MGQAKSQKFLSLPSFLSLFSFFPPNTPYLSYYLYLTPRSPTSKKKEPSLSKTKEWDGGYTTYTPDPSGRVMPRLRAGQTSFAETRDWDFQEQTGRLKKIFENKREKKTPFTSLYATGGILDA